jgi:DNA invertase Pin-like site-specific DNA recombinase
MREEIRKLYEAGVSIKGIAKKVGTTETNVCNYLSQMRKKGEVGRRAPDRITPEEKEERNKQIIQLYKSGMTAVEIYNKLSVGAKRKLHAATVYHVINDAVRRGIIDKQPKKVCTFTPGKACLTCPFDDCVRGAIKNAGDISSEEVRMVKESGCFRKTPTVLLDDEYTCKRRYINGYRNY